MNHTTDSDDASPRPNRLLHLGSAVIAAVLGTYVLGVTDVSRVLVYVLVAGVAAFLPDLVLAAKDVLR